VTVHGRRFARALLWLGVAAPLVRHLAIYGLGAATPGYSAATDFISELGAVGAPYGSVMNAVGIGLVGVLMLFASVALYERLSPLAGGRVAAVLLAVSGFAYLVVAVSPCDPGCRVTGQPGARMILHLVGGFVAMGAQVASALVPGLLHRRRPRRTSLGRLGLGLGLVGAAAYLLLLVRVAALEHPGAVQRVVQAAGDAWLLAVAIAGLREGSAGGGDGR